MTNLHGWLASGSTQLWPFVLNHLWQSTVFLLVLWPVVLLLKRAPARFRYTLSLVASAKFLLPAALVFFLVASWGDGLRRWFPTTASLTVDLRPWLSSLFGEATAVRDGVPHAEIYCLLTLVWLLGVGVIGSLWYSRQRALVRVLDGAQRVTSGREAEILRRVQRRLGIARPVELALLASDIEPGVFRIWRPVLLLPAGMPATLSDAELESIFLHELVHIRRRDNLIASLHRALCCLFWFHPLVWVLDRRLLSEREEACDEGVLALGGRAEIYARGLLKTVQFGLGWRVAGVSSAGASDLKRRLARILAGAPPRPSFANHLGLAAALVLLASYSLVASSGSWNRGAGVTTLASMETPTPAAAPLVVETVPHLAATVVPPQRLQSEMVASVRNGKSLMKSRRETPSAKPSEPAPTFVAQRDSSPARVRRATTTLPTAEKVTIDTEVLASPEPALPSMQH